MPIVIWGSRGITRKRGSGRFYCPDCDRERDYELKEVQPFFTLYFIPLFPTGSGQRFVECLKCGSGFPEAVLDRGPAPDDARLMENLREDLEGGLSLEKARDQLVQVGMDRREAERTLDRLSGGKSWHCSGCGQRYLDSVTRCKACR
jgi:hypothetical protein